MRTIAPLLFALALAGCSTLLAKDKNGWGAPYAGTECAADLTLGLLESPFTLLLVPFALIDIPLSLVADTLVLPKDLWTGRDARRDCAFFHI